MSNSKNIRTRLADLAAQEGCDGEPYDTMQAASECIAQMELQRDHLNQYVYASERLAIERAEFRRLVATLAAALGRMLGAKTKEELDALEFGIRTIPAPESDKAAAIDAIDALRLCIAMPAQESPAAPEHRGWYCANCQRGVDASEVTHHEQHEACGRVITDDRPPAVPNRAAFDLLMRDICETEEADFRDDRTVCVDYDWLYQRIEQAMLTAATDQPQAALAVPDGWRAEVEKAIERARVFDDGSDGADADSARSVVSILAHLLDVTRGPL